MSFNVNYYAWNNSTASYVASDSANHSITVRANGVDLSGLTITEIGGGQYQIVLTDAQLSEGSQFSVRGTSSTANVSIHGDVGVRPRTPANIVDANVVQVGGSAVASVDDFKGSPATNQSLFSADFEDGQTPTEMTLGNVWSVHNGSGNPGYSLRGNVLQLPNVGSNGSDAVLSVEVPAGATDAKVSFDIRPESDLGAGTRLFINGTQVADYRNLARNSWSTEEALLIAGQINTITFRLDDDGNANSEYDFIDNIEVTAMVAGGSSDGLTNGQAATLAKIDDITEDNSGTYRLIDGYRATDRSRDADALADIQTEVEARPTAAQIAAAVRTNLAIELARVDENVSDAKTLTSATLATLFDDSDASQQLTDFFAGLIARFDEAGDTPVATISATILAALIAHPQWIELLADAEAARAAAVANGTAISGLPAPLNASQSQAAAAAAIVAYDPPTRAEATNDKQEILDRGNLAWTTGTGSGGGGSSPFTSTDAAELRHRLNLSGAKTDPGTALIVEANVVQVGGSTVSNVSQFQADVSGLSDFAAADVAALILETPANKLLTNASGHVTTANPATGGSGSNHTAADVAALILETPANKLLTDSSGHVTATNGGSGGGSGDGDFVVTVTVRDSSNNPIAGAKATLQQSGTSIAASRAGTNGIASIAVDDGSYDLIVSAGLQFQTFTQAIVVNANSAISVTLFASPAGESDSTYVEGNVVRVATATDWHIPFNIGALSGVDWERLVFTAKTSPVEQTDAQATVQIALSNPADAADGLLVIEGGSPDSEYGEIVVTDATTGDGYVRLLAAASEAITPTDQNFWDADQRQVIANTNWRTTFRQPPPFLHWDVKRLDGDGEASANRAIGYAIVREAVTQEVDE